MINIIIYKNKNNEIFGFNVNDHADNIYCAAVSALVLNTVNCVEHFTNDEFVCETEKDGYINFYIPKLKNKEPDYEKHHDSLLLLKSLELGLQSLANEYNKQIKLQFKQIE